MGRKKSEDAEKLAPFAELVGKIPDARIAEMAGVSVEAVAASVVAPGVHEGGPVPESWLQDAPEAIRIAIRAAEANGWTYADLTGTGDDGDPAKGVSKRSGLTMAQMAATPRPNVEPTVDLEPVPDPDEFAPSPEQLAETVVMTRDALVPDEDDPDTEDGPPPHAVRLRRKARVLDERGRLWVLKTRDVFTGTKAHFLWVHHRDLVEPFPS